MADPLIKSFQRCFFKPMLGLLVSVSFDMNIVCLTTYKYNYEPSYLSFYTCVVNDLVMVLHMDIDRTHILLQ